MQLRTNELPESALVTFEVVEEAPYVSLELPERLSPLTADDVLHHEMPQPFNKVQVRRVRR